MTQAPSQATWGLMAQYNLLDRLQQIEVSSILITVDSLSSILSLTQSQQKVQFALPYQGVGCLAQLGERRPYKP